MRFGYAIAPLGKGQRPRAKFDAKYQDVDLSNFSNATGWAGIRVAGLLSGHTSLDWPLGRFVDRTGDGDLTVTPPAGVAVLPRTIPPPVLAAQAARHRAWGPFNNDPRILGDVPIGGELHFKLSPEWITIAPSVMATPTTFVAFEGRTAYGERSTIPFHVTSADWQESDRVLAGIMTAFGSSTTGGRRWRHGRVRRRDDAVVQAAAHRRPLPRRRHARVGRHLGPRERRPVIEDSYVSLTNAQVTDGTALIETDGRFALGYPRKDGGEEINARIRATRWPLTDLRHAFVLDDWPLDGRLSGEFHLYGKYETPFGFGNCRSTTAPRGRSPSRRRRPRCGSRAAACGSTASKAPRPAAR